jgi:hypothetical protein
MTISAQSLSEQQRADWNQNKQRGQRKRFLKEKQQDGQIELSKGGCCLWLEIKRCPYINVDQVEKRFF